MEASQVLIAIQARSTSKRLPNKVMELIDGRPMIDHVLGAANSCSTYMGKTSFPAKVFVCVVVPEGDPLKTILNGKVSVIEGSEDDVLSRYAEAVKWYNPDYLVRITSDCPLIPPGLITEHIRKAIKYQFDYLSNVDPLARTAIDGFDVEVISRKAFDYLAENARDKEDREHVTPFIRKCPPIWAKIGHVMNHLDFSDVKLSVDTKEDLDRVREMYARIGNKIKAIKGRSIIWMV